MRVLVDTNAYVSFCKGEKPVVDYLRAAEEIYMPFVVIGELRAGFDYGTKSKTNERKLQLFLNSERVRILFADEDSTHHYARLFGQLIRAGTPIPTNDLWIASLALQHNLQLISLDEHFDNIPQLLRASEDK